MIPRVAVVLVCALAAQLAVYADDVSELPPPPDRRVPITFAEDQISFNVTWLLDTLRHLSQHRHEPFPDLEMNVEEGDALLEECRQYLRKFNLAPSIRRANFLIAFYHKALAAGASEELAMEVWPEVLAGVKAFADELYKDTPAYNFHDFLLPHLEQLQEKTVELKGLPLILPRCQADDEFGCDPRTSEAETAAHPMALRFAHVHPTVIVVENFLSAEEVRQFKDIHYKQVKALEEVGPPLICVGNPKVATTAIWENNTYFGTNCMRLELNEHIQHGLSWSYSTSVLRWQEELADTLDDRIYRVIGLHPLSMRNLQILSYSKTIAYNTHTDCDITVHGGPEQMGTRSRVATFLSYLTEVEGGETAFPYLNLAFKPKPGTAVFFFGFDDSNRCDILTSHRSNSVLSGEKVVLQKWFLPTTYTQANIRLPADEAFLMPPVAHKSAYVLCDDSDSCRWYDRSPMT